MRSGGALDREQGAARTWQEEIGQLDCRWLKGKGVLVTGAGGGIGRATTTAFLRNGATVLGADLDTAWTESLRGEVGEGRERLHSVVVDVTDSTAVATAVDQLMRIHGRLDVAVAAAGIQAVGSVENTHEDVWRRVMDINLTGSWLLAKHSLPAMRRGGGGTLLLLGSTAGLHPRANLAAYCVSKAAVTMLARVLGREAAADGIRAIAVCPTGTETPLLRDMIAGLSAGQPVPDQQDAGLMEGKPVQRWLSPDEVAAALTWLTSPAAAMVTGSSIPLDFGSV
jgi:NAD(P)-dependent dehydrogenase (short-subunit alcohol dehydrogenase family)